MIANTFIRNLGVSSLALSNTVSLSADTDENVLVTKSTGTFPIAANAQIPSFNLTMSTGNHTQYAFPGDVTGTYGSFMFIVSGSEGNATATFLASKSDSSTTNASIFKLVCCAGTTSEIVDILWPAYMPPCLYHSTVASGYNEVTYTITVLGRGGTTQQPATPSGGGGISVSYS